MIEKRKWEERKDDEKDYTMKREIVVLKIKTNSTIKMTEKEIGGGKGQMKITYLNI